MCTEDTKKHLGIKTIFISVLFLLQQNYLQGLRSSCHNSCSRFILKTIIACTQQRKKTIQNSLRNHLHFYLPFFTPKLLTFLVPLEIDFSHALEAGVISKLTPTRCPLPHCVLVFPVIVYVSIFVSHKFDLGG